MEFINVVLANRPLVTQLVANLIFIGALLLGHQIEDAAVQQNAVEIVTALFLLLNAAGLIIGKYWGAKGAATSTAKAEPTND